jgi:hypothetical protein
VTPFVIRLVTERFHRDADGRPIREGRTPPEFRRDGEIEYRTCVYPGSRHGKPMNVSALKQTGACWPDILDALAQLRTMTKRDDLLGIWRVSQLGSALPWLFIFRGEPVPAYAAALSKATLGMGIWAQREQVSVLAGGVAPRLTPTEILGAAEQNGTLVGHTEVCSAPKNMLIEFFEALVGGIPSGRLTLPDGLAEFGTWYSGLKQLLWIYFLARRFLYADLGARDYLDAPIEPPDFFVVEPDLASTSRPHRRTWLRRVAELADDHPLRADADAIADAMALVEPFGTLDRIFAGVVARVEAGFRRALGAPPWQGEIDRDRLLAVSPRKLFEPEPKP